MPKRLELAKLDPVLLICKAHKLPRPEGEFEFHAGRRWRFDYCWPSALVALEVNGGVWSRGRHVRGEGYLRDLEKLNRAQLDGWRVLQCTPQQVQSGAIVPMLKEALT